jgi:hypothetical protein
VDEEAKSESSSTEGEGADDGAAATLRAQQKRRRRRGYASARADASDDDELAAAAPLFTERASNASTRVAAASGAHVDARDDGANMIAAPPVEAAAWFTELERVKQRLAVVDRALTTDAAAPLASGVAGPSGGVRGGGAHTSDWRAHMDAVRRHASVLRASTAAATSSAGAGSVQPPAPPPTASLLALADACAAALERVAAAEGRWNREGDRGAVPLAAQSYRVSADAARDLSAQATSLQQRVMQQTQELQDLVEAAAAAADVLAARVDGMTSTSPLQDIRAALAKLRRETHELGAQVGVLQHAVAHAHAAEVASRRPGGVGRDGGRQGSRRDDGQDSDAE